jgi:KaiC/GvpD/RAD55 family RecA-like ATPase
MDGFNKNVSFSKGKIARIHTGIEELDDMLTGGLPKNSVTLISGTPGSGKSIMCFHYIQKGLKHGEQCLYLTSDERIEGFVKQAHELGFDFWPALENGQLKFMYIDLDKNSIHKEIDDEINNNDYTRVVLDSLTPIAEVPVWVSGVHEVYPSEHSKISKDIPLGSPPATRTHVRHILSILSKKNCTAMVTSEIPEGSRSLSRDTISEFLVDGIILMDLDMTMDRRKLTIRKMRGTKHTLKPHDIAISEGGIQFL